MQLLAETGLNATRRVIDVCGDGTNNAGREVADARDDAVKAGITINGLAIINDHPVSWTFAHVQPPGGLANYYRENVTGGPGSFVLEVHDFASFGEAMTRKLVDEIATAPTRSPKFAAGRLIFVPSELLINHGSADWSDDDRRLTSPTDRRSRLNLDTKTGDLDGTVDQRRMAGARA